ncbi:MAG TPA: hypothetical protein VIX37_15500 [Candidatus Sulfotelmatobacter sp.]
MEADVRKTKTVTAEGSKHPRAKSQKNRKAGVHLVGIAVASQRRSAGKLCSAARQEFCYACNNCRKDRASPPR